MSDTLRHFTGATFEKKFPILVYHMDEGWAGVSLLTCTTAVCDTPHAALVEVIELLDTELDYALAHCDGDVDAALAAVSCSADDDLWMKYFAVDARLITSPPTLRSAGAPPEAKELAAA